MIKNTMTWAPLILKIALINTSFPTIDDITAGNLIGIA